MTCTARTCRRPNCPSASRCLPAKRRSPNPASARRAAFRAALPRAAAARDRMGGPHGDGGDGGLQWRHDLSRSLARRPRLRRRPRCIQIRHYWRTPRRAFWYRRIAGFAQHRVRVRRQRHPAWHGGDPARRLSSGARDRCRRIIVARIAGALLTSFRALHSERSARASFETVFQEPRRLRAGGGRRRARPGRLRSRPRTRRAGDRHYRGLR